MQSFRQALVPRHPGLLDFEEHFADSVTDSVDVPGGVKLFKASQKLLARLALLSHLMGDNGRVNDEERQGDQA
jgi:hypothetical protein